MYSICFCKATWKSENKGHMKSVQRWVGNADTSSKTKGNVLKKSKPKNQLNRKINQERTGKSNPSSGKHEMQEYWERG